MPDVNRFMTKIVNNMVDTCIFNHISERQVSLNKNNRSVMDCQSIITVAYKANLHNNVDVPVVVCGLWSLEPDSLGKWTADDNAAQLECLKLACQLGMWPHISECTNQPSVGSDIV